ncbi:type I-E CRISPR-associated protein Cas6/Cse3/CasE [Actinosynnema sp. NPDC050436]|uniref:type I-E CRISPR-associated protein Cas6/Cse3/CasE n=1 Tax=Actinosynnema sp. NPDC050436 TaxID=3155659 RepID=UPI0033E4B7CB
MISLDLDTPTLTKIIANPAHPHVRRDLRDVDSLHRTVTDFACPPGFGPNARQAAGLLYRVEETAAGVLLLVQSKFPVDSSRLPPGYGHGGTRDLQAHLARMTPGTGVRYRIVANPTKQVFVRGQRGTVRSLSDEEAHAWWQRKATQYGLELTTAYMRWSDVRTGLRKCGEKSTKITVAVTQFEGTAFIRHPEQVREGILNGIGRAKSYGCGLLSLAVL